MFVFLLQTHPIYIQESSWFWYIAQKYSQPIGMQNFLILDKNTHEAMELGG